MQFFTESKTSFPMHPNLDSADRTPLKCLRC